ncbi:unnamed protein product, partial [Staurois parvus]
MYCVYVIFLLFLNLPPVPPPCIAMLVGKKTRKTDAGIGWRTQRDDIGGSQDKVRIGGSQDKDYSVIPS